MKISILRGIVIMLLIAVITFIWVTGPRHDDVAAKLKVDAVKSAIAYTNEMVYVEDKKSHLCFVIVSDGRSKITNVPCTEEVKKLLVN